MILLGHIVNHLEAFEDLTRSEITFLEEIEASPSTDRQTANNLSGLIHYSWLMAISKITNHLRHDAHSIP